MTIFLVFFGISLLDALRGGHWLRALFWIGVGLAFWLLDRRQEGRQEKRVPRSGGPA